jgi:hypothetical protein
MLPLYVRDEILRALHLSAMAQTGTKDFEGEEP